VSRGLPFSLAVHLLMLAVVVIYGSYVPAPPLRPQHLIRVRLTEAPKRQSGASEAAALPPSEPVIQQPTQESPPPAQEPEPQPKPPEPEPQTLPVKKPEQKVVTPPEDKPKPQPESKPKAEKPQVTTEPEPSGGGAEQPAPTGEGEPVLSGTDEPFPFAWYLDIVKGRITRNWNPPQLGIRAG
jgi:outer membrane biosynthesis protein TonB